ncbi:lysophospholipid acyltransferase family protein [Amycolatopsis carbonis]|uniref:Lysophospholipid acyltransferase family protein n=1 Tax=Amycolatopsis carbonis TaxID=715471 RepID=A0A9Y2MWX8_9PSEU|nr:lysophospholipid acyltransferase family protein [Amycolatopsis sp. 2-15]WIX80168.1 lysophospholipid acyltransferase family protein [Amycolatopsis sp. 2-15]
MSPVTGSEAHTVNGAEAQVIPLHGPGRVSPPAAPPSPSSEPSSEAPVVAFPAAPPAPAEPEPLPESVRSALAFLRNRLTGDYTVDEFGFDAELTETLVLPPLRALYEKWFRVDTFGVENLPATGGALLVSNHSGTLPLDALMTAVAVHDETGGRHLRGLGADLVFKMPLVGSFARKAGQTLACNADAERLLSGGELVGVWPEGFKGIGKPFSARYKLQRFGRGGFVSAAMRAGVPIIPVSVVGAEETYPKLGDLRLLARVLGLPYFPVTPFFPLLGALGAVPLPTKWTIEFGEPIRTDDFTPDAVDDPMLVFTLTDQVRESIQQALYRRLAQRKNIFRG